MDIGELRTMLKMLDVYKRQEICMKASSVLFIDYKLYNYCLNGSSLSHSYRPDRLEKSIYLYKYMNEIANVNNLSNEIKYRIIDNFFINLIEMCIRDSR